MSICFALFIEVSSLAMSDPALLSSYLVTGKEFLLYSSSSKLPIMIDILLESLRAMHCASVVEVSIVNRLLLFHATGHLSYDNMWLFLTSWCQHHPRNLHLRTLSVLSMRELHFIKMCTTGEPEIICVLKVFQQSPICTQVGTCRLESVPRPFIYRKADVRSGRGGCIH